jgi:hypothetical protein
LCGTRCPPPLRSLLPNPNRPSVGWMDKSTDLPEVRVTRSLGRVVRVQMCVETDAPPRSLLSNQNRSSVGWMDESTDLSGDKGSSVSW